MVMKTESMNPQTHPVQISTRLPFVHFVNNVSISIVTASVNPRAEQSMTMLDENNSQEHPSRSALIDGVVWDEEHSVRWQSMPEYLNFDAIKNQIDPAEYHAPLYGTLASQGSSAGDGRKDGSTGGRPPKGSVTLSDFLASEESCGSCDFGWFTPSASGGSIDDLVTAGEGGVAFAEPGAPGYPNQPLAASEYASTANTAPLSPLSAAGKASREGCAPASREDLGHLSHSSHFRAAGVTDSTSYGASFFKGGSGSDSSGGVRSIGDSDAGRGVQGLGVGVSTGSVAVGASRLLRRASTSNRMPEINQWHALHRHASSSGPLAAEGAVGGMCTFHLRRLSYPISTRHFPEKLPEPRVSRSSRGRVNLNGGSPAISGGVKRCAHEANTAACPGEAIGPWEGGGLSLRDAEEPQLRKAKPKSYAWALTEIRVVSGTSLWVPPRAEYLVVACLGHGKLVAGWRRASDFARLARIARRCWMSKVSVSFFVVRCSSPPCTFGLSQA